MIKLNQTHVAIKDKKMVRDIKTRGIVSVDVEGYNNHKDKKRIEKTVGELQEDFSSLKKDIDFIKNFLVNSFPLTASIKK